MARGEAPTNVSVVKRPVTKVESRTFDWCAAQYVAAKSGEWRNPKHQQQWVNTLSQYASAMIGRMEVASIDLPHIMAVLTQPQSDRGGRSLWESKTETASRLRGRIERVLDWATVSGYRRGENPARWRGRLDTLLAAPTRMRRTVHYPALPFAEVPAFFAALRARSGLSARALELLVLTAARSGEVRGAKWSEVNFAEKVWTIPAERMKAGKVHRVPLSDAAIHLLEAIPRIEGEVLIFPGAGGRPLSDMSLSAVTRRMDAECVPHGFRSSFRDWAAHERYPREVAELCLAHTTVKTRVEAAYWRDDALAERAEIMQSWAGFCEGEGALGRT